MTLHAFAEARRAWADADLFTMPETEANRLADRLAEQDDAAVAAVIGTPARTEADLEVKLSALRTLLDDGAWADRRELRLAASIADDARALGLIPHTIRAAP